MDSGNDGRGATAICDATPPPTCAAAAGLYLRYRAGLGGKSETTVSGEAPGILGFAKFMDDRAQGPQWWRWWGATVEEWALDAKARLSEATFATRASQVREFTRWCIGKGWAGVPDLDPWAEVHVPKPMPVEHRRLTAAELLRVLEHAAFPRDRVALAIAMNTGLRGKEICDLRVRDVDLPNRRLHVRITKTREVDAMPITADLELELRRWLVHYAEVIDGDETPDDEAFLVPAQYVSGSTIIYKPYRRLGEPHTVVARACQRAALTADRDGFHTIRRSIARIYFDMVEAESSEDRALIATMTLLHHSRPETTLRYIGKDRQKEFRDEALQGRRFLTRVAGEPSHGKQWDVDNVVPELRRFG